VGDKANFPAMPSADPAGGAIRVLLADDDRPFVEALQPLIERQPDRLVVSPGPKVRRVRAIV